MALVESTGTTTVVDKDTNLPWIVECMNSPSNLCIQ